MKFQKLFKIITEAKGTKPGERFYNAQQSAGPMAGVSSSPVGKVDNLEIRQPLSKWEYDPSLITGESGINSESKIWKSMLTSFGLLNNDEYFDKQLNKISKKFKESLDSYKNIKGINEDGVIEKYDEENQLEKLERNQSKYMSDLTGLEQDLKDKIKVYNRTLLPPSEIKKMDITIAKMQAEIKKRNELLKTLKMGKKMEFERAEIDNLADKLNKLHSRFDQATMPRNQVEKVKASIFDTESKIEEKTKKLEKVTEELNALYERINTINATNEEANNRAIGAFTDLVVFTAKSLSDDLKKTNAENPIGSLETINWNAVPTSFQDKINRLDALSSTDSQINPILGYLERFQRSYEDKDFEASKELDKNVNITKIRDRNRLPFMVLLRVYMGLQISNIPLNFGVDDDTHKNAKEQLDTFFKNYDLKSKFIIDDWNDPGTKDMLKALINDLALPDSVKDLYFNKINSSWSMTRSGLNSFGQLKSSIESDLKRYKVKVESFDTVFERLMNERFWDDDDFKIDTMEILSLLESKSKKCTGPTKKASSSRKGKKWTKCARQPDGSYKRIHWGQKGVKVTGKSGNTKRKKSFRARHKCSSAKQGSSQQAACNDW